MNKLKAPEELNINSGNKNVEWRMFKQMWTNFETATDLDEKPSKKRVATLLNVIGKEAVKIYNTFKWSRESDKENIEIVIDKFEKYCTPKKNITYERYMFNTKKQDNETVDEYVTSLRILASNCEFGIIEESLVKDMLVLGVKDKQLRENMLLDSELTLEKAINMARANERTRNELKSMNQDRNEENEAFAVRKYRNKNVQYKDRNEQHNDKKCWFCGNTHEWKKESCPAFGKTCNNCRGRNHFATVCKKKQLAANEIDEEQEFTIQ